MIARSQQILRAGDFVESGPHDRRHREPRGASLQQSHALDVVQIVPTSDLPAGPTASFSSSEFYGMNTIRNTNRMSERSSETMMRMSMAMTLITTIFPRFSVYFTCWKVTMPVSARISTHHASASCPSFLLIVENRALHEVFLPTVHVAEHHVLLRLHRHLHRLDLVRYGFHVSTFLHSLSKSEHTAISSRFERRSNEIVFDAIRGDSSVSHADCVWNTVPSDRIAVYWNRGSALRGDPTQNAE